MDVISQAVLGSSLSQSFAKDKAKLLSALLIGALSGMAPDLDVLIRSTNDPLLFLEYHRQFTHSLIFIPFGALICAFVLYYFFRKKLSFSQIYLFSLLGFASHGLLDACTSYGTQLFWPFSTQRVSWSLVSIIDPLFTFPILFGVIFAAYKKSLLVSRVTFIYAIIFLSIGLIQKQRAENALQSLVKERGHTIERFIVKPSFANRVVWKMIYEFNGKYYVDAVKLLWDEKIFSGDSISKLNMSNDFKWLKSENQQAKDIERFRWFSDDYLAIDPDNKNIIFDVRYSFIPNEINLMWGIVLDKNKSLTSHVKFTSHVGANKETRKKLIDMVF